jgi:TPR repeat protein
MRFRNGDDSMPPDDDNARTYLSAAAKLNHAEAQFELFVLLGQYNEWPEATSWLESAVSMGFGPAQKYLAEILTDPLISPHIANQNYSEIDLYGHVRGWYEQKAGAGDAQAQYEFARWLYHHDSPIHDRAKALQWMKAAAEQDHGFACMWLGEWLLEEKEPEGGAKHGVHWLSRAANLGESHACRILGDLYLYGCTGGRYVRGKVSQFIAPDKRQTERTDQLGRR